MFWRGEAQHPVACQLIQSIEGQYDAGMHNEKRWNLGEILNRLSAYSDASSNGLAFLAPLALLHPWIIPVPWMGDVSSANGSASSTDNLNHYVDFCYLPYLILYITQLLRIKS